MPPLWHAGRYLITRTWRKRSLGIHFASITFISYSATTAAINRATQPVLACLLPPANASPCWPRVQNSLPAPVLQAQQALKTSRKALLPQIRVLQKSIKRWPLSSNSEHSLPTSATCGLMTAGDQGCLLHKKWFLMGILFYRLC